MDKPIVPAVSVVILTLNAGKYIETLLDALRRQTVAPVEVLVVDSASTDDTVSIAEKCEATVVPIARSSFNHGGTRNAAFQQTKGEYVLFLTQDALPRGADLIARMVGTLNRNPGMALVYGRHLPREDASAQERLIREYNYPPDSHIYGRKDVPEHGIKTFFSSDTCAMYKRDVFERIGGFEADVKTNEDMFYAARAIASGYLVGYDAKAEVIHSHNFTLREQYRRNYIQGYEIERHRDLLAGAAQSSEGMKLVAAVSKGLLSKGRVLSWIRFGFDCCARYLGNWMGKKKARKEC